MSTQQTEWDLKGLVMWADETLLVLNKPAGLLVIRGGYGNDPYLAELLEPTYGRIWIVHRLDRPTSGVLVVARTADAHRNLNTQFEQRDVNKVYHALVKGSPSWSEYTVRLALRRDGDRRHRTVVDPESGKSSTTHLTVLERLGALTLIEARPKTGRTHQIRAHLAALGMSIVADKLYWGGDVLYAGDPEIAPQSGKERILIARPALHAHSITFSHPTTGEELSFTAPYPRDLAETLVYLQANTRNS
jgi:RluA family pseudouridine synthase